MASYTTTGIEGLMLDLADIAEIPEDVIEGILDAESRVVVAAHKKSIRTLGLHKTGLLESSIKAFKKRSKGRQYVLVYPSGDHHTYHSREQTKVYKNSKHGRTYTIGGKLETVTSNEVGFIHEFGAPRKGIKASQWMKKANDSCGSEVEQAAFGVYDNWLKSKNL